MLRVLQCNLNHCRNAQDLLMQKEIEKRVGISIISEPYNIPEDDNTWLGSRNGLSAIHWCRDYTIGSGIPVKRGHHYAAIKWMSYCIVACYISPNVDVNAYADFIDEMEQVIDELGPNIIIDGDFNSKNRLKNRKKVLAES